MDEFDDVDEDVEEEEESESLHEQVYREMGELRDKASDELFCGK